MVPSQRRINLTMLVKVRRMEPAAIIVEGEHYHAFADIEKQADVIATPVQQISVRSVPMEEAFRLVKPSLPGSMLETAAFLLLAHAANGLSAEDFATEKADTWVGKVFPCRWTPPLHYLVL